MIDWYQYKFRCHALGKLMTGVNIGLTPAQEKIFNDLDKRYKGEGRPLTEKQQETHSDLLQKKLAKPKLATTVKTELELIHKEHFYGIKKELYSKYIDKGLQVEPQSISLYSDVVGMPFFKNKERRESKYLSGEPDNVFKKIRDIKSSWNHETFPLYKDEIPNKIYYWQLQGYMQLWDMEEAELIYCLVDTPEEIIQNHIWKIARDTGYIDLPQDLEEEIRNNLTFSHLPKELRVKIFKVKRDRKAIEMLYKQLDLCRQYLKELDTKVSGPRKA